MTTRTSTPDREAFREMLATLAAKTKTKIPELNGRVEKALRLALAGDVELHGNGTATVYSSSDPTRRYEIIEGTCTCRDYEQAPQHLCQHRLSAGLVRRTHALLPPPAPEPAPPAAAQPAAQPATVALPEARCSVNVHVTIAGRPVQITLRGHQEAEVLTRLEALLDRYPVPPSAASAQGAGAGWCAKHNTALKLNHGKDGRTWLSHRTPDGQWCKGT